MGLSLLFQKSPQVEVAGLFFFFPKEICSNNAFGNSTISFCAFINVVWNYILRLKSTDEIKITRRVEWTVESTSLGLETAMCIWDAQALKTRREHFWRRKTENVDPWTRTRFLCGRCSNKVKNKKLHTMVSPSEGRAELWMKSPCQKREKKGDF